MSDNLYQLQGVERSYGSGEGAVHALAGVDLAIGTGELLAIEGPSGSGKSTLLQLLGALDRPTAGSISFDGKELSKMGDSELTAVRATEIGFVFQAFNLIPTLSAAENVEAAMVTVHHTRVERHERVNALLDRVGLAQRASHLPSRLSGGEQQRVAIARALAMHPAVLMLDEPTSALDPRRRGGLRALLRGFAERGHTMLIVSHSIHFLKGLADQLLYMEGGEVVESGATDELLNSPKDARTRDFLAQAG
jgi:putative ABC transport system ATP-binding protein